MNTSNLINLYSWSNQITGYLATLNIIWVVLLVVQDLIQHNDLDDYVFADQKNGSDN